MSSLTTLDKPQGLPATSIVRLIDTIHTQQMRNMATVTDPKNLVWNGDRGYQLGYIYEDQNSSQMFAQSVAPLISNFFCYGINVSLVFLGETRSPLMAHFYGMDVFATMKLIV